jgi:hypothetical protein
MGNIAVKASATEDEGQDQEVDNEETTHEPAEQAPALEDRVAGRHVPASDPLREVKLDERPDDNRPEEDRAVHRTGVQ